MQRLFSACLRRPLTLLRRPERARRPSSAKVNGPPCRSANRGAERYGSALRVGPIAALAFAAACGGAQAHPHVFVTAKEKVIFGPDGRVTGVRAAWTFDDMYSSFVTQGLGAPDEILTPDKLAPLAKTNVESLAEFGYFTVARLAGHQLEFSEPKDYSLEESKDKLVTLFFTLPLKTPVRPSPALNVSVYDPTYFVSFGLDDKDPVSLAEAPAGCSTSVIKPRPLDAGDNQKLSEAFFANMSPGQDFGIKLASKVMVACP